MKNLIISSLLIAIFYTTLINAAASTLIEATTHGDNTTYCNQTGQFCLSCRQRVICERAENGSLIENFEQCDIFSSCSSNNGSCVSGFNEECDQPEFEFECRTEGVFPDPFDCKKYYYCVPFNVTSGNGTVENGTVVVNTTLLRYPAHCSCGYRYDTMSKACDVSQGICSYYPVGSCFEHGETSYLWSNPSLYYICQYYRNTKYLYPFIYSCEHGKKYNRDKYLCE